MKRTQLDRDCDSFCVVESIGLIICLGRKGPIPCSSILEQAAARQTYHMHTLQNSVQ